MARILFTWELGGGMGHVAPYLPLIEGLRQQGHTVAFALRNLKFAESVLGSRDIPYFQAPVMLGKTLPEINPPHTFAQILNNVGYVNIDMLTGLARAWRQLFESYKPDVILYDHSPTALLASRGLPCKKVVFGTGFFIPPDVEQIPVLRNNPKPDPKALLLDEVRILGNINKVLQRLASPAIERIPQLYEADEQVLMTFREIDHFKIRQEQDINYWGISRPNSGVDPVWPDAEGKRIYAYLKPFKSISNLLQNLKELGMPTLIYAPEVNKNLIAKFSSPMIRFAEKPFDLNKVATSCDIAITNANHATVVSLLLAGIPQLLLPIHLEQSIVAHNVEQLGAGLAAQLLRPEGITKKLKALLDEPRYAEAARAFADKYSTFDADKMEQFLLDRVLELAAESRPSGQNGG